MSGKNSDALRDRWADPAYRERQTEANRRASQLPRILSKRKTMDRAKLFEVEAARLRQAYQNAQAVADQWQAVANEQRKECDEWKERERTLEALIISANTQAFPTDAYTDPEQAPGRLLDRLLIYRAGLEVRDARIQALEYALIYLENWIVMAERAGVALPLPVSFGQWRRPEPTK